MLVVERQCHEKASLAKPLAGQVVSTPLSHKNLFRWMVTTKCPIHTGFLNFKGMFFLWIFWILCLEFLKIQMSYFFLWVYKNLSFNGDFQNFRYLEFFRLFKAKKVTPYSLILSNPAKEHRIQKIQETSHYINPEISNAMKRIGPKGTLRNHEPKYFCQKYLCILLLLFNVW